MSKVNVINKATTKAQATEAVEMGGLILSPSKKYKGDKLNMIKSVEYNDSANKLSDTLSGVFLTVASLQAKKLAFRDIVYMEIRLLDNKAKKTEALSDIIKNNITKVDRIYKREANEVISYVTLLIKNSIVITGNNYGDYVTWSKMCAYIKSMINALNYATKHNLDLNTLSLSKIKKAAKIDLIALSDLKESAKDDYKIINDHKEAVKLQTAIKIVEDRNKLAS